MATEKPATRSARKLCGSKSEQVVGQPWPPNAEARLSETGYAPATLTEPPATQHGVGVTSRVHTMTRRTTRASTSQAKRAAYEACLKVDEHHARRRLGPVSVRYSEVSSVNPDPVCMGRAPRKLFADEDIPPCTPLAYFYFTTVAISTAVDVQPHDCGVDLQIDGAAQSFFLDKEWETNAWYAADHMGDANSELVPGRVHGIDAVLLISKKSIKKDWEIGHRYTFPKGEGPPLSWGNV